MAGNPVATAPGSDSCGVSLAKRKKSGNPDWSGLPLKFRWIVQELELLDVDRLQADLDTLAPYNELVSSGRDLLELKLARL